MGVKSCSRGGCESIMVDTYVHPIGYVCYECQSEFKEWIAENQVRILTEAALISALTEFMETRKGVGDRHKVISIDEFFNQHTT